MRKLFPALALLSWLIVPYSIRAATSTSSPITLCVKNTSGEVRFLQNGEKCKKNEDSVVLNQMPDIPAAPLVKVCTHCFLTRQYALEVYGTTDLSDGIFEETDFVDTHGFNFTNADLSRGGAGGDQSGANFTNAQLSRAKFINANLENANFSKANLLIADLRNSDFTGADFTGANLTGADLTGATTTGAIFTRVIWSGTYCPDGTNSDDNGNTCVGHLEP